MRTVAFLLTAAALLSGCQSIDGMLTTEAPPPAMSEPAARAIAGDLAGRLAAQMGTATSTTIEMDEGTTQFARALEAALHGQGYTVVMDDKGATGIKTVELAHSIDNIDGQTLARLSTPSLVLGRAYVATAAGASPTSPLSIMQMD